MFRFAESVCCRFRNQDRVGATRPGATLLSQTSNRVGAHLSKRRVFLRRRLTTETKRPAPWGVGKLESTGEDMTKPAILEITGKGLKEPKGKRLAQLTQLREAAVAIVQSKGQWESIVCGNEAVRVMCAKHGQLSILYKTPFQNMWDVPGASKLTGYLLEVFHGGGNRNNVVLGLMWDDNEPTIVVRFLRGDWENEILEDMTAPAIAA
jgi:hypothetical protein